MAKKTEVAVIDEKTGNPVRDEDGELVTKTVNPATGAEVKPASSKSKKKSTTSKKTTPPKKKAEDKGGSS